MFNTSRDIMIEILRARYIYVATLVEVSTTSFSFYLEYLI